jgi:16S rRNA (guanine966-N2)-methyltransferase
VRVVAGIARGRRLAGPPGRTTRPLTDRAKEALFSSLGVAVPGSRVLDLFAGAGGLGLEALSRGAVSVTFVERDRRALEALRRNIAAVGLGGTTVVAGTVESFLERTTRPDDAFHVAFVDPPYALALPSVSAMLSRLVPHLAPGAVVVVHRRRGGEPPATPDGMVATDRRNYGDAELFRFEKVAGTKEAS